MLQELNKVFRSNIKSLEILYLLKGIKPAARIMVKEEDKEGIFDLFRKNSIYFELSGFKVVKQDREKAYSDKGMKVPIGSSEKGYFFVYASKRKGLAEKAKEMEEKGMHRELGAILGYPECCSSFFERHFDEMSKRNNDFTMASLRSSSGLCFPFYTNIAARHFDLALLNHFPCSFSCAESIKMAKKHLKAIEEEDKEAAEIIKGMLKGAVLYTEDNGVFLLRKAELTGGRLSYLGVMGSKNNHLYESLKKAQYIEVLIGNKAVIDGKIIDGAGVMVFG
ncbi:hypothetical protein KY358_06725 [Candidatus Woesearchaeota archaeon]|nr:hypothetical protein [Candidatus Woesearchaeota archaeon]